MSAEMEGKLRMQEELKDLVEKEFIAFPDIAADVINALLYDGESFVSAGGLLPAPTETLYAGSADKMLHNQYEDLAKYDMRGGRIRTVYLFANQTRTDSRMILRKAGYTGGAYREQYEVKLSYSGPVIELVLYWGEERWHGSRSIRQLFSKRGLPQKAWQYIDNLQLHVWEMRYLPQEVRERFTSDMRIVLDFLDAREGYRSDRPVVHKEALIKMIRVLSGDYNVGDTAEQLAKMNIKEEDEITVCELFEQYVRKGRNEGIKEGIKEGIRKGRNEGIKEGIKEGISEGIGQGIKVLIMTCRDLKLSFVETAERVRNGFNLDDEELQKNMELYWTE